MVKKMVYGNEGLPMKFQFKDLCDIPSN